jgi:nicotinamidase/pyrazinamidase
MEYEQAKPPIIVVGTSFKIAVVGKIIDCVVTAFNPDSKWCLSLRDKHNSAEKYVGTYVKNDGTECWLFEKCNYNNALLIVDVQNDFLPGGPLGVKNGNLIIDRINKLITSVIKDHTTALYVARDWHKDDTKHFVKFPRHCVQNTIGADFPKNLNVNGQRILIKGSGDSDDISAFNGSLGDKKLITLLNDHPIKNVFVCGVGVDGIKATAIDARLNGYNTYVISDASACINTNTIDVDKMIIELIDAGVGIVNMAHLTLI